MWIPSQILHSIRSDTNGHVFEKEFDLARSSNFKHPRCDVDQSEHDEKIIPEPDEQKDFLDQHVDWQDTLHGVEVDFAKILMYVEIAKCHDRKLSS